ncbi:MAG: hypothetical protein WD042_03760 [Phycisphaeraceae bacterium]
MIRTWAILALAVCAIQAAALAQGVGQAVPDKAARVYQNFNQFCLDHFGALKEELTYALPGQSFKLIDTGSWTHVSESSACLAWETNLPANSYVEYGPTIAYGSKTAIHERPFYLHIHYLKGLEPGTTYHYRLVATDERGQQITTDDHTLTPKRTAGVVYIPGNLTGPPYVLDQADTTYVLTQDLHCPTSGLAITARNVTVDLNGHTITYNDDPDKKENVDGRAFGALAASGSQGVRVGYSGQGGARLYNGTIIQGKGGGGNGFVPILFRGAEIAGVTLIYHGSQVTGIDNEARDVHHNVILDCGEELTNRHQGVFAIKAGGSPHHNLIKRTRQNGIAGTSNAKVNYNEIYVDSCSTNSFGINFYKSTKSEAQGNRIFGRGYLAIGIGTVSEGVADIKVADNFIHLQAHAPDTRWNEYGAQSGAYGLRVTWGGKNIEYSHNVVVTKARDGGMARGIWFCPGQAIENVVFRDNTIKTLQDDKSSKWGAIVISGEDSPEVKPGLFINNTVIADFCHVRLAEEYGTGNNARFVGNRFIRAGNNAAYATIRCGFWTPDSTGSVFLDTICEPPEGGADLNKVVWEGTGKREYGIAWTLTVKTSPGAAVTILDKNQKETFRGAAGADGVAKAELVGRMQRPDGPEDLTPFAVTVVKDGQSTSKQVTLTQPATLEVALP